MTKKVTFHSKHQVPGCQNDIENHQKSFWWDIQHNWS